MDRRGFMSAMFPVWLMSWFKTNGDEQEGAKLGTLAPGKYILFADPDVVDIDQLPSFEGVDMDVVEVKPRGDQTITDCVLLYKVSEDRCDS